MLVKDRPAADEDPVFDPPVSAKERVVGNHHPIANPHIVSKVRPGHEEAIIAHHGGASFAVPR